MDLFLTVFEPASDKLQVGLVSQNAESQHNLGPAHPNRPIRFCVGEPGRRSTIWRLWAGKKKSDIYIASRKSAGIFKVSLHESGDWRIQWVNRDPSVHVASYEGEHIGAGRIIHQWVRTPSSGGWTDGVSIWVPGSEVVSVPGDSEPYQDVQWMQAPPEGWAVEFRVVLLECRRAYSVGAALSQPGSSLALVNGFFLPSGEVLVLLASTKRMTKPQLEGVQRSRQETPDRLPPDFDLDPATGPRSAVIALDSDGYTNIWDLAL